MPASTIVLIVEDDVLIQDLLSSAFIEAGYDVCVLGSGRQALAHLSDIMACPQALLTDINLGAGPSGWEVGRCARDLSPSIAVIYMSGDSGHEWRAQGVADSVMITKPFAIAKVVDAMGQLLATAV